MGYTASSYPYTATDGTCKTGVASGVQVSGYKGTPKDDRGLFSALQSSAFIVSVQADSSWQHYASGVITGAPTLCTYNHVVTLTGGTKDYFKIKNSWGLSWGEEGYIRFQRSTDG